MQKLDLSGSGIQSLAQLNDLDVEEVDIRGLDISSIEGFKNDRIKTIILRKEQLSGYRDELNDIGLFLKFM